MQDHHRNGKETVLFECDRCSNVYPSTLLLGVHRSSHGARYTCPTCNRGYAHRSSLRQYSCHPIRARTTLNCRKCNEIFDDQDELTEHMDVCIILSEDENPDDAPPPKKRRSNDAAPFNGNCEICGQISGDLTAFEKHRKSCVQENQTSEGSSNDSGAVINSSTDDSGNGTADDSIPLFSCSFDCGERFSKKKHLKKHHKSCAQGLSRIDGSGALGVNIDFSAPANNNSDVNVNAGDATSDSKPSHVCAECGAKFAKKNHSRST